MTISAIFANADRAQVAFTDNLGATRTVPADWPGMFRMEEIDGGGVVGFLAAAGTIAPYAAPSSNGDQVDAERERRIALPLTVTMAGLDPFPIDMTSEAQRNIGGLATVAILKKMTADTSTIAFRDADNVMHDLDPDQLLQMGMAVQVRISTVYAQSWAIKAIDPIPQDFAADSWWV